MDNLWEKFWTGGITNPLTVIEQISYLMFARTMDMEESRKIRMAQRTGKAHVSIFPNDEYRWNSLMQASPQKAFETFRDKIFPMFKEKVFEKTTMGRFMAGAQFLIPSPNLFAIAIEEINKLPLHTDSKGDLYEHLLSKLSTAGINGQFRTPKHIIRAMTEIIDPHPTEKICDPACGTAGFLVAVMEYLRQKYTSPDMVMQEDGYTIYPGDLLMEYNDHMQKDMFTGFDFDSTMLRVSCMNLLMHGIDQPNIHYQDALNSSFKEHFPKEYNSSYDVIMANPPFKGSLDHESVNPDLQSVVKTKKTELLFLALMVRLLKMGGRCAVIVPDGVLFGSSTAHVGIRQMLVDQNQLEAVISLPSGVFKPYAGVSTAILIFTKGGNTENVWFYDVQNDGFSLDDKRQKIDKNDLPELIAKWKQYDHGANSADFQNRKTKAFIVPADEIRSNKYDLSLNRYKEVVYEEVEYDHPIVILDRIDKLEQQITNDLATLREMISE
jgi:type I restriction enzyme M protein